MSDLYSPGEPAQQAPVDQRGEVRPDADFGAVADAILGSLMYWVTARRSDLSIESVDSLLDVLLRGLRADPATP
ncbi:hypothetical protein [Streptomyces sp. NPDC002763]|uniref:hypothetical protein n=1 Tax=Streptomyces sp. NPDC002763 TaxID=3154427 RepID=UPI00332B9B38